MKCPACGAVTQTGSAFCSQCGKALATSTSIAPGHLPPSDPAAEVERPLWQGAYSPKAMIGAWLLSGLATIVLLVAAFLMNSKEFWIGVGVIVLVLWNYQAAVLLYRRLSVRYALTTQRLVHESGILRRVNNRILVIQMDDIAFEQGPIERMTGVGTIRIMSADPSNPTFLVAGIDNVRDVCTKLDEARREERRRRGLYMMNM